VLTQLKAYSSWHSASVLPFDEAGAAETDLIQVRNIDGLDPVKASVNTTPFGSVDGASYVGSSVPSRNIVLTLNPNPNWDNWTFESLRRLLYSYFMPKRPTRLVFYSDDMVPVKIEGIVEGVTVNPFSKNPELLVSIICPDPYFIALEPTVITGQSVRAGGATEILEYNGTVEAGFYVRVTSVTPPEPTEIGVQIGDPAISYFTINTGTSPTKYFEMSSVPMRKYVQNVEIGTGIITNLLSKATIEEGSAWPMLQPGENEFALVTDQGVQDWELTYFERFGGL
jgi:Phage tail protein RIFT-related domain